MNKRKYKKSRKKINKLIFLDEFFTIDYTKEEYKQFLKDVEEYCYKHHRYKHYKDKNKYGVLDFNYTPPLANKRKIYLIRLIRLVLSLMQIQVKTLF